MSYTYGPVQSRRLGSSLGVNITPNRICSFNCIYCEEGTPTQKLTIRRDEYAPTSEVIEEIITTASNFNLDYITFSGSGEPTLHSELGQIIASIKEETNTCVAVLTNSSTLFQKQVRTDLSQADLVVPSLDAITSLVFQKINRPHSDLQISQILNGITELTIEFKGLIYLEILLVAGINDSVKELQKLAKFANKLKVDKIHLNTVSRATTETFANNVSISKLIDLKQMFVHPVEIYY